jgi:hypothetical protein
MAQWAGVLATSTAIMVALFKESIIRLIRHPRMTVNIEAKYPDCVRTPVHDNEWKGSRYFLRLWIANEGSVRADKVEVFLSQALVKRDGDFSPVSQFTPMNLRWSYSDYNKPQITVDGISPGMKRLCDFGAVTDPEHPVLKSLTPDPTKTRLSLQLEALQPATDWLLPGKYTFEVKVVGSNCKPVSRWINFHLTGVWSEGAEEMMSHGFVIN